MGLVKFHQTFSSNQPYPGHDCETAQQRYVLHVDFTRM